MAENQKPESDEGSPAERDEAAAAAGGSDEPRGGATELAAAGAAVTAAPPGAAWAVPFVKVDVAWTKFETWLVAVVLALEIFALSLWVFLKGMSTPAESDSAAGIVFRAITGAVILGMIGFHGFKKRGEKARTWAALAGTFAGIFLAKGWVTVGVDYTSNLLNWYQQASTLTLFGGLRGIGTRLTLMLALLGGSLATARGKHITIDLITRYIHDKLRLPIVLVGWVGAGTICLAASWGFFDHIAIEDFGAKADATAGEKIGRVVEELGEQAFMVRKQLVLDVKSTPHIVLRGERYAEWLTAAEWNQWLEDAGFRERYGERVDSLKIPEGERRAPMIIIPGLGEPRGELVHMANLVFPFGLLVIALRFFLRSVLALSGHVSANPEDSGEFTADAPAGGA